MVDGKGSGVWAGLGQMEFLCRVRTEKTSLDCGVQKIWLFLSGVSERFP